MKKKLTLNKNNATILERMNEIYLLWDIDAKEARDVIKKMYYGECNEQTSVQDTRLILHNLVRSELDAEDTITNSAKLWAKTLLDFLNNELEYVAINPEEYAKAMNNYLYTHKEELSDNELITAYENYYDIFKEYKYEDSPKYYMEKLISKFNLNLAKKIFNEAFNALKGLLIHNNDIDYMNTFEYCANELKDVDINLYNQILLLSKDSINKIS